MKYTIISINDSRSMFKHKLNYQLQQLGWSPFFNKNVPGHIAHVLDREIEKHGYEINYPAKVGQLGIWYSVLNTFHAAPHVTFEDDAVMGPNFALNWHFRFREMPEDTDFFSLFLPRDSNHLWTPDLSVSKYITRTYQRYGGVSMYYTPQGVEKIRALLERDGITGQYDDTLYAYSKAGELNGYCSKPELTDLVHIVDVPSIVQESEFWKSSV